MGNFLPEGYERIPSSGRYMKLADGENVFRVLGRATTGWVYWNNSNKPVRLRERPAEQPHDIRIESDGKPKVKHFWAFPVWNYADRSVQVLEVTQSQIQSGVKSLVDSKHWGDPKGYDVMVSRSGSGLDTEYVVQGIPPKPVDASILEEFARTPVSLDALYDGGDPFAPGPSAAEAIDGPGHSEPTITVDDGPLPPEPPPGRYDTVPEQFRPPADSLASRKKAS